MEFKLCPDFNINFSHTNDFDVNFLNALRNPNLVDLLDLGTFGNNAFLFY